MRRLIGSQLLLTLDEIALNVFEPNNETYITSEFSKSMNGYNETNMIIICVPQV